MRVLVTYYSETGNTEKVAQAIFEGIIGEEKKDLLPLNEIADVDNYDVIFCGFPVHAHSIPAKMESFIRSIPEGKKLAYFATHGSLRGGQLAIEALYYALSLSKKGQVIGTFCCRGEVKSSIIDALMEKVEHRDWAKEAQGAIGHPDDSDLHDAKAFVRSMIAKLRNM
jgi:flavodoxin